MKRKSLKILFALVLCMGMLNGFVSSCSDDDAIDHTESDEEKKSLILDSLLYQETLDMLSRTDTLENGNVEHSAEIGRVLHSELPYYYYVPVDSLEEAKDYFINRMVPYLASERITMSVTGDMKFEVLGGSLMFNNREDSEALASVDVSFKELPHIEKFIFMRSSEWPLNDMSSPFTQGQIWINKSTKRLYICTVDCKASAGKLITFDGGWGIDQFRSKTHWQGKFDVVCNCAGREAWEGMRKMLEYNEGALKKKLTYLKTHNYESSRMYKCLDGLINRTERLDFNIGNHKWDKHLWYAYYCYDVTINYFGAKNRNFWSRYYTHEDTPINGGAGVAASMRLDYPGASSEITFDYGTSRNDWTLIVQ